MRAPHLLGVAASMLLLPASLHPQAAPASTRSDAAYVRRAQLGAPRALSAEATVARIEKDGRVTTLRQGSNEFTCTLLPDGTNAPFCGDRNAWQWAVSAFSKQPKPGNSAPGVAYMMQGGTHFETRAGEIMMEPSKSTHDVKEPPHWMIMWPVDPAASGLPTRPNPMGAYVMFAGTPYAHLMIYQNPASLRPAARKAGAGTR